MYNDDKSYQKKTNESMPKRTNKSKESSKLPFSTKDDKLTENLLKVIQQFLSGKGYQPMSANEIVERLNLAPQHVQRLEHVLQVLLKKGIIEITHEKYALKQKFAEVVTGILSVHSRGFGFLRPENPTLFPEDIFIPKHLTLNAVDGDKVEVVVNTEVYSEKGPEGKVVKVLSRSRTHIAGIISEMPSFGDIIAYVPLLGSSQRVIVEDNPHFKLKIGDRIVMEVIDWGSKDTDTFCKMSRLIGHIDDPSTDIVAAIQEFELRSEFPDKVIKEAKSFGNRVSLNEIASREDLRHLDCFTIDPDTAKDYDDAVNLTKDKQGNYLLGVHIADVSHYVSSNSELDKEALERCNSTYFPGFCLPMLPHELSSNLCSLKANVNRLTASVLMEFDANGDLLHYRITRSVIKSRKRMTYREAKKILDGAIKSPHADTLKLMVEFCRLLKIKRYERGSLEFAIPELVVQIDEKGFPKGLDRVDYDVTHQLIEEFMLKTNEVIATHLTKMGKGIAYRIHDTPAEENMKDFAMLARTFGYNIPEKPSPKDLQDLFEEALKTSYGQYLATSYIKRMRLAIYSTENIGHYGLGLTHYCHFTSPIRRYIDLVDHRILFGENIERDKLQIITSKCSEQERISAKAENNVVTLKKLRLLKSWHEKEPKRQYQAIVTRVRPFGIFFEVLDLMMESFLHVSELESDYFIYHESQALLKGRHTGMTHVSGDKMIVMLKHVNFILLESEWSLVASDKKNLKKNKISPSLKEKKFTERKYKKKEPNKNKKARRT
jgi:ribonuclease R